MKQFIEFTTRHTEATYGSPIYDPDNLRRFKDIEGVRVDGEQVEFRDASIPVRLERYLIEARRRKYINDCIAFVAIMNGIPFDGKKNPFQDFDKSITVDPRNVDVSSRAPLVLTRGFHDMKIPLHIILPAHTDKQNYLHKLGDDGPLCMSNLSNALRIMDCHDAHPV